MVPSPALPLNPFPCKDPCGSQAVPRSAAGRLQLLPRRLQQKLRASIRFARRGRSAVQVVSNGLLGASQPSPEVFRWCKTVFFLLIPLKVQLLAVELMNPGASFLCRTGWKQRPVCFHWKEGIFSPRLLLFQGWPHRLTPRWPHVPSMPLFMVTQWKTS